MPFDSLLPCLRSSLPAIASHRDPGSPSVCPPNGESSSCFSDAYDFCPSLQPAHSRRSLPPGSGCPSTGLEFALRSVHWVPDPGPRLPGGSPLPSTFTPHVLSHKQPQRSAQSLGSQASLKPWSHGPPRPIPLPSPCLSPAPGSEGWSLLPGRAATPARRLREHQGWHLPRMRAGQGGPPAAAFLDDCVSLESASCFSTAAAAPLGRGPRGHGSRGLGAPAASAAADGATARPGAGRPDAGRSILRLSVLFPSSCHSVQGKGKRGVGESGAPAPGAHRSQLRGNSHSSRSRSTAPDPHPSLKPSDSGAFTGHGEGENLAHFHHKNEASTALFVLDFSERIHTLSPLLLGKADLLLFVCKRENRGTERLVTACGHTAG